MPPHKTLIHYTLNTGDTRDSPRSEVADEVISAMAGTLGPGEFELPIPDPHNTYFCRLDVADRAFVATVYCETQGKPGRRPLVTFGVADNAKDAGQLWPVLQQHYHTVTDLPGIRSADFASARQPDGLPWCASVVIMPTLDESLWLGDFERCLAWAWLEQLPADEIRR